MPACSRDPAEIIPGLFIGSLNVAKNATLLNQLGVTGVVNASKASYSLPQSIHRFDVSVDDSPGADMASRFHSCCEFINKHLQAGVKPSLREAYDHTCAQKPNIMPNTGFFRQLLEWELEVVGTPSMTLREYYKIMLLDYGFGRAEVAEVVDAAPSDDYHAIVDRLHARHGVRTPDTCHSGGGGGSVEGDACGGCASGGAWAGEEGDAGRSRGTAGGNAGRWLMIEVDEEDEGEEGMAVETEGSEVTPETTPGSSIAQTPC